MTNSNEKILKVSAPGRINIIGEHTDYNDGFVLPAAINKGTTFHFSKSTDKDICSVTALDFGETFSFSLSNFAPLESGWQNYVMGVVSELQKRGGSIQAFDVSFSGTVPIGSGMSSSAALECGMAVGLNHLFQLGLTPWELIEVSQKAEHQVV